MNYFLLPFLSKSYPAYSSEIMFFTLSWLHLLPLAVWQGWVFSWLGCRVLGSSAQLIAGIKDCFAFWLGRPYFLSLQILLAFATQTCSYLAECISLHPANGAALPFQQWKLAIARSIAQHCFSPKWTKWNLWIRWLQTHPFLLDKWQSFSNRASLTFGESRAL